MKALEQITVHAKLVLATFLCLAAGCATKPVQKSEFTFFPPPPDEPRIQFLTGFGSETDLGGRGKFSSFVVGEERVFRPIWKPYGLAVTKGMIYVCDTEPDNICMVDIAKGRIKYHKPEGNAAMTLPINIAVDADGTRYVTDTKRCQVMIYRSDGSFVEAIGKKNEMKPCGIAVTSEKLYITDLSNHCVRVYNKATREVLLTVPPKPDETNRLFSPTNIAVDDKGQMYVSDSGGFMIKIYGPEGNHLRTIGDLGLNPGRFALPKGIAVDKKGRIFVIDAATALAQVFDEQGRLLMYFGEPKSSGPGAMYLPAGLAVDYQNQDLYQKYAAPGYKIEYLIFVTNQAGPHKVSVYGFLKKG